MFVFSSERLSLFVVFTVTGVSLHDEIRKCGGTGQVHHLVHQRAENLCFCSRGTILNIDDILFSSQNAIVNVWSFFLAET